MGGDGKEGGGHGHLNTAAHLRWPLKPMTLPSVRTNGRARQRKSNAKPASQWTVKQRTQSGQASIKCKSYQERTQQQSREELVGKTRRSKKWARG